MSIWSWLAGGMSVAVLLLMGNKYWWSPLVGLLTQVVWFIYVFHDRQWGLLLCVIAYTIVHLRNSIKWAKEK